MKMSGLFQPVESIASTHQFTTAAHLATKPQDADDFNMQKFIIFTFALFILAACSTPRTHQVVPPSYTSSSELKDDPLKFEMADQNGDGHVAQGELEAMAISHFKNLDSNKDGSHAGMILTDYLKQVDTALDKADEDKDKKLSPSEFMQLKIQD